MDEGRCRSVRIPTSIYVHTRKIYTRGRVELVQRVERWIRVSVNVYPQHPAFRPKVRWEASLQLAFGWFFVSWKLTDIRLLLRFQQARGEIGGEAMSVDRCHEWTASSPVCGPSVGFFVCGLMVFLWPFSAAICCVLVMGLWGLGNAYRGVLEQVAKLARVSGHFGNSWKELLSISRSIPTCPDFLGNYFGLI